jgi:DNA-binding response OmpR family regulator
VSVRLDPAFSECHHVRPMILAYEATPEPSVLLACGESEAIRLLAIVLEGFGYIPLECRQADEARDCLEKNLPQAALVDLGLEDAMSICSLVDEADGLPLLIVLDEEETDPQTRMAQCGAKGWVRMSDPAERILRLLREVINGDGRSEADDEE